MENETELKHEFAFCVAQFKAQEEYENQQTPNKKNNCCAAIENSGPNKQVIIRV